MTPASSGRLEVGEVSAVGASAIHPRFHAQRMDLFGGLVDIIDHEADVEDPAPNALQERPLRRTAPTGLAQLQPDACGVGVPVLDFQAILRDRQP
jgi:hypothetical protein